MPGGNVQLSTVNTPLLACRGITKTYPGAVACDGADLTLFAGEVHALLGENGAGKTTLTRVLFGLCRPDAGTIHVRGTSVTIRHPSDAIRLGIGMARQHPSFCGSLTLAENIVLGAEGRFPNRPKAMKTVKSLCERHSLSIDHSQLSVSNYPFPPSTLQVAELLKMLHRGAEILVFDEPTAALSPDETDAFLRAMRSLAVQGKAVLLITHRLAEIEAADRCTVMRAGKAAHTAPAQDLSQSQWSQKMIDEALNVEDAQSKTKKPIPNSQFTITGVACSNGQEAARYLRKSQLSWPFTEHVSNPRNSYQLSVIPQDGSSLALGRTLKDNLVLTVYKHPPFSRRGLINSRAVDTHARTIIDRFGINAPLGPDTPVSALSGGNRQKAVLGRETARSPEMLIAVGPTRGLDPAASSEVHARLRELRDQGCAVLLISADPAELLSLSDRLYVLREGTLTAVSEAIDEPTLARLMAGHSGEVPT